MTTLQQLRLQLESGAADERLGQIYTDRNAARQRLLAVLDGYSKSFGTGEVGLFTGPGRTEMGGNHTDHQHGHVLAGAIDLDAIACAGANGENTVRIVSAGYPAVTVVLDDLTPQDGEKGTSAALVRGIAARFTALGHPIFGFNACISSTVLGGSGLSSSAAYEVLIGTIFSHLFCGGSIRPVQIAQIGQYAENVFFGKPCGLMDQLASAEGGICGIDFADPAKPIVNRLDFDLTGAGYALCIIDSGADHADLTDDYAAITEDMAAVSAFFGKTALRDVDEAQFWQQLAALRGAASDRAIVRAIHYFSDDLTAQKQALALERDHFPMFLSLVKQSALSSARHLQNLYSVSAPEKQAVTLSIALAEQLLGGEGAVRVHGGGFAGTIQAYVPLTRLDAFKTGMEAVLGAGHCHVLRIRAVGGSRIL